MAMTINTLNGRVFNASGQVAIKGPSTARSVVITV
jgi:hypothetical protein